MCGSADGIIRCLPASTSHGMLRIIATKPVTHKASPSAALTTASPCHKDSFTANENHAAAMLMRIHFLLPQYFAYSHRSLKSHDYLRSNMDLD